MGTLLNGGKPLGFSVGDIAGKGTGGQIINGLLGSLLDPANITGMFGKNVGPGAFMDPNGVGGGLFPGQSLGAKGIFGINPEGTLGMNSTQSSDMGQAINMLGAAIAGGEVLGGGSLLSGLGSSGGATSGTLADGASYSTAGMSADVPSAASTGGGLGGLSTFQEGQLGLQALPILMKLLGGGGQQQGAPQGGGHNQIGSVSLPQTPMGPQQLTVPSQAPTVNANATGGGENQSAAGLVAYLKSQGMLNA